jgi:hypothetical protein
MAESAVDRWLRPRYVLPALGLLLLLAVFTTPQDEQDAASRVMTTYGDGEWGLIGLYRVLDRLRIPVSRGELPLRAPLDSDAVYVVLAPVIDPSARDAATLLDAVKRGAGLVIVAENGPPLSDSVQVGRSKLRLAPLRAVADPATVERLFGTVRDPARDSGEDSVVFGRRGLVPVLLAHPGAQRAEEFRQYITGTPRSDSDTTRVFATDTVTILAARADSADARAHPVIMGRRLGRGRIVILGDANFLRNDALRHGAGAVLAVRLLEWVSRGERKPVVFDEYHQGYGSHDRLTRTILRGLTGAPAGRAALQAALAALVLLLALSVRPIAPVRHETIERRSPLEHVGALSRAYAAVGATRLASRRLLRGLRRRHPLGATGALDDDGYLALLRERAAGTAADAAFLKRAIHEPLPAADLVRAGLAIDHLERTLTS